MPFDANLELCDGSYDWSYANLVTSGYGHPHSTNRVGGFAVIDILDISTTAAVGMSAIFICDEAGEAEGDALTLVIQGSNLVTFVQSATNPVHTLATFEIGGASAGVILGNEVPATVVRRFHTTLQYIRAYAVVTTEDDFHTCYVLLAPWPFHVL